jgi:hypothetical protein
MSPGPSRRVRPRVTTARCQAPYDRDTRPRLEHPDACLGLGIADTRRGTAPSPVSAPGLTGRSAVLAWNRWCRPGDWVTYVHADHQIV